MVGLSDEMVMKDTADILCFIDLDRRQPSAVMVIGFCIGGRLAFYRSGAYLIAPRTGIPDGCLRSAV